MNEKEQKMKNHQEKYPYIHKHDIDVINFDSTDVFSWSHFTYDTMATTKIDIKN